MVTNKKSLSCDVEVADDQSFRFCPKQIGRLDVTVDDSIFVEIAQSVDQLADVYQRPFFSSIPLR